MQNTIQILKLSFILSKFPKYLWKFVQKQTKFVIFCVTQTNNSNKRVIRRKIIRDVTVRRKVMGI